MQRRKFLGSTGSVLGGLILSHCGHRRSNFTQPLSVASQHGVLSIDLTAGASRVPLLGKDADLLNYNQQVPGPQWTLQAGDTVQVTFTNQLSKPTNLHFHGLHIPPTGTADNVFLSIPPGEVRRYSFTLPREHLGGLFWYHPHQHGLTAEQVFGGLAGTIVVRGTVDEIPEVQAAEEAILVLQDFDLNRQGQRREPMPMFRRWGREGNTIAINGDRPPHLTLPQNGMLRLRLLNAAPSRFYQLRLENHPWYLIGLDGGFLPEPTELEGDLLLAPGERADLLVPGTQEPNTYRITHQPYDRGIAAMMGGMHGMGGMGQHGRGSMGGPGSEPFTIAHLDYGEAIAPLPLPQALIAPAPPASPIRQREFVLDHGIDNGQYFLINGKGFDHHRVDTAVQLGTVEDWRITNKAGMDHPFHIHTNAFQVLSQNGQPFPFPAWKDVVNIKAYETVDLRIAFTDFPGKTVYHCHILDHEDQGMMGVLDIQDLV